MKKYCLRTRLALKLVILVPFIIIICLNFQLSSHVNRSNNNPVGKNKHSAEQNENSRILSPNINENSRRKILNLENMNANLDKNNLKPEMTGSSYNESLEILKKLVNDRNNNPHIRNRHLIDNLLEREILKSYTSESSTTSQSKTTTVYKAPNFLVILVQVHSRLNYLKELIESLRQTKYIEESLVVFSHDIYDTEMNNLIENIDFCAVISNKQFYICLEYFIFKFV